MLDILFLHLFYLSKQINSKFDKKSSINDLLSQSIRLMSVLIGYLILILQVMILNAFGVLGDTIKLNVVLAVIYYFILFYLFKKKYTSVYLYDAEKQYPEHKDKFTYGIIFIIMDFSIVIIYSIINIFF